MGHRTKQNSHQRETSNGQETVKEMFNILSHQVKTTLRFHLIPIGMAKIKKKKSRKAHACEDVEQGENSSIAGESINLYNHYGNQFGCFSENWEQFYLKTQ